MHIADGVIPFPVLAAGNGAAAAATGLVLWRFREDDVSRTAVLASLFFVLSAIAIPTPFGGSAHLLLSGLLGILLGWHAFPAILIALLFQRIFLGFGGVWTLGVNTLTMGAGALASHYSFKLRLPFPPSPAREAAGGAVAGAVGPLVTGLAFLGILMASGRELHDVARMAFLWNLPVLAIESACTAFAVAFLARVKPGLLEGRRAA